MIHKTLRLSLARTSMLMTAMGATACAPMDTADMEASEAELAGQASAQLESVPDDRIVGGSEAEPGAWPSAVSLQRPSGFHFCGGTLVHPRLIVTAKHCVDEDTQPSDFRVVTGRWDLSTNAGTVHEVDRITFAPNGADIAVVQLHTASSAQVSKILAPGESPVKTAELTTVVGWGRLSEGGATPDRLRQVNVPVVGRGDACNDATAYDDVAEDEICIGPLSGGMDSCQGDSGGPVFALRRGAYELMAVVSWGVGCARPDYPGVYAELAPYWDWLQAEVNAHVQGQAKRNLASLYRNSIPWGTQQALKAGRYDTADLSVVGNDTVSSLLVSDGVEVRLCSENGGWGDCQDFIDGSANLGVLDDRTSFARVRSGVSVYENKSYGGKGEWFGPGLELSSNFDLLGNDTATSLTAAPGYIARLCSEGGWGTCRDYSGNVAQLDADLDNRTSSVQVLPGVTAYRDASFGGVSETFAIGKHLSQDFKAVGNDTITSLIAAPGIIATVCSEGFWGHCQDYSGEVPQLGKYVDNTASSIEVKPGVTVYSEREFGGRSQTFSVGTFPVAALDVIGNDTLSSLVAAPGVSVRICSEGGWDVCRDFSGAVPDVGSSIDNKTSWIQVTSSFTAGGAVITR
jgi:trypsin